MSKLTFLSLLLLFCFSLVQAAPKPTCTTFFFLNAKIQSPPTSTAYRSVTTSTSSLPCGRCTLETQAYFPYPYYAFVALEAGYVTTITAALGISTKYVCASSTGIKPSEIGAAVIKTHQTFTSPTTYLDPHQGLNSQGLRPVSNTASHATPTILHLASKPKGLARIRRLNSTISTHGSITASRVLSLSAILHSALYPTGFGKAHGWNSTYKIAGSITASRLLTPIPRLSASVSFTASPATPTVPYSSIDPNIQGSALSESPPDIAQPSSASIQGSVLSESPPSIVQASSVSIQGPGLSGSPPIISQPSSASIQGSVISESPPDIAQPSSASIQGSVLSESPPSIVQVSSANIQGSVLSESPPSITQPSSASIQGPVLSESPPSITRPFSARIAKVPYFANSTQASSCTNIGYPKPTGSSCISFEFSDALICNNCPSTPSELDRCPFLCTFHFSFGLVSICSLSNIEDKSNISSPAATCQKCLPPCSVLQTGRLPSPPSPSTFKISHSSSSNTSVVSPTPLRPSSSISSIVSSSSSSNGTSSSCVAVPPVVDHGDPCQTDFNDNLLCNACPTLFEVNIFLCPFLCEIPFQQGLVALQCSPSDLGGQSLPTGNGTVTHCRKCLTDCPAPEFIYDRPTITSTTVKSTATTITPTCTKVSPGATSDPFVLDSDGTLYKESCGTSKSEVEACPFLCSGAQRQFLSRCTKDDQTGTTFDNAVQVCNRCLPGCDG